MQHRADAEVLHLLGAEAEAATHQQRDDADVHRMRRCLVAGVLDQHPDAELVIAEHLVDQGLAQRLGLRPGFARPAGDELDRLPAGARRLAVLALAHLLRFALRVEAVAPRGARPLCGRSRRLGAAVEGAGPGRVGRRHVGLGCRRGVGAPRIVRRGSRLGRRALQGLGLERCRVALQRAPAHALQAERADRRDLRRRGDAKAAEGKRMRHPADVEMHEHPDAKRLDVDHVTVGGCLHEMRLPLPAMAGRG